MIQPNNELRTAAGLPEGFEGPRGSILVELKRDGTLSAKSLAGRLGLSLNAIRHHLRELEAEAVINHEREARGVGAPIFNYRLTDRGSALFPARYEAALTEVLDHLVSSGGRDQAVDSLNVHYQQLGSRLADELAGAPAEQRVARVVRVLRDEGYMTVWDGGRDEGMLTAHNCAMRAVAQRFPEICEAERHFLTEVLAADVTRGAHMLEGCSACEYHIDFRVAAAGQGPVEEQV
jgi:DeoR family suf operon transcriptional repressor